ncbi:hypothetical protein HYW83_04685 [Candidatus Peregrinibacteria bacterium]|nr:hypothetical protein [Candidatus Peregrinibacteria bacterium]
MKKLLVVVGILVVALTLSSPISYTLGAPLSLQPELIAPTAEKEEDDEDEDGTDCSEEECPEEEVCEKDIWKCDTWTACSADGVQKRTCKLLDDCPDVTTPQPTTSQKCEAAKPTVPSIIDDGKKTTEDKKDAEAKKLEEEKAAALKKASELKLIEEAKKKADSQVQKDEEAKKLEAQKAAAIKKALLEEEAQKKALEAEKSKAEAAAQKAAEEEKEKQRLIEEAQKKADEELKLAQEELFRKQAEEEARRKAEEELAAKIREEAERKKVLEAAVQATPVFEEIFVAPPVSVAPLIEDFNNNGIPDNFEVMPKKVDEELIKFQADLKVQEQKLVTEQGQRPEEARDFVTKVFKKKKAENKVSAIREASKKKGVEIKNSKQGVEKWGTSDEVAVLLGINPREVVSPKAAILPVEKKLLRIKDTAALEKKCSMSIANGDKLPTAGFTILAACPKNKSFNLVAVDRAGKQTKIETKPASENGKLVYVVNKKLFYAGDFVLQLQEEKTHPLGFLPSSWFTSALNSESDQPIQSDPVLVKVVEDIDIPQPVVQSIEGIDVADLRDIKISATADGKVRVTGLSDISTMVIGTFSSAVFTSAILADVESGSFEVVSPRPLETGDHEVVIYATKPEESEQSPPVKLRFSIIQTANAASAGSEETKRPVAIAPIRGDGETKKFPMAPVLAFAGLGILFIGIGLYLKKNKKAGA